MRKAERQVEKKSKAVQEAKGEVLKAKKEVWNAREKVRKTEPTTLPPRKLIMVRLVQGKANIQKVPILLLS
eukprot:1886532-Karenia_brevis.AAC.1